MGVPVRPEDLRLRFIVEEDAPLVSLGHPFQALVELLQVLDALGELGTLLTQGSADLRCRVIENLTHRVQPETSLPVRDDSMQPLQVRVGVLAIAGGGAHGRRRQADLVPMMKRADGHSHQLSGRAHRDAVTAVALAFNHGHHCGPLRRSRGEDSGRGEIMRFLAVRIELLRRGEHDPRTLGVITSTSRVRHGVSRGPVTLPGTSSEHALTRGSISLSTHKKLTLIAGTSGTSAPASAGTSRTSWNAHRRRWTTCPGMLNSSMKPNPRTQKSVDAAKSDVGTVTNTGIA